ncbi:MAG: hypothetical protein ACREAA_21700 [Candidatus Polarisedimenticolia bacterium]
MSAGIVPSRLHLGCIEKPSRETVLFLDRPSIPGPVLSPEMAPQFRPESLAMDGLARWRRLPLTERLFDRIAPCF